MNQFFCLKHRIGFQFKRVEYCNNIIVDKIISSGFIKELQFGKKINFNSYLKGSCKEL